MNAKFPMIIITLILTVQSSEVFKKYQESNKLLEKANTTVRTKAAKKATEKLVTDFLKWEKHTKKKNPFVNFTRNPTILHNLKEANKLFLVTRFLNAKEFHNIVGLNNNFYKTMRGTSSKYKSHLNPEFVDHFDKYFVPKFPEDKILIAYFDIFCAHFGTDAHDWFRTVDGKMMHAEGKDLWYVEDNSTVYEYAQGTREKYEKYPLVVELNGRFQEANWVRHIENRKKICDGRTYIVPPPVPKAGVNIICQITPQNFAMYLKA